MSYLSLNFALFLAGLLIVYYLVPKNWMKQGVILTGNLIFCWGAGVPALVITLTTTFVCYGAAILIERKYADYEKVKAKLPLKERVETFNRHKKKSRVYLYAALVVSIAIFAYVKIGRYLGWESGGSEGFVFGKSVIVPIGISYYTFMLMGYVLDVYWDRAKAQHNYLKFLMCTTYFPHIISGPFGRLDKLGKQFEHLPKFEYRRFCFGMQLALWGLFQKLVISEGLRIFVTTLKASIEARAGLELIIAMVFGVLYSFTDFNGCMDMVRGISQAIGVELDENFRQPFFSRNIGEFWRRWHITLGAWMRDYIFIPITRSRRFRRTGQKLGKKNRVAGILFNTGIPSTLAWLFSAAWHGTGVHYLLWGVYYTILLVGAQILEPAFDKWIQRLHIDRESRGWILWQRVRTVGLFCIGASLTSNGSVSGCVIFWKRLFSELGPWVLFDKSLFNYGLSQREFWMVLFCVGVLMVAETLKERGVHVRETIAAKPLALRWCAYYALIFAILIFGFYGPGYNAADFIYAQF